jgi:hypothetical protein
MSTPKWTNFSLPILGINQGAFTVTLRVSFTCFFDSAPSVFSSGYQIRYIGSLPFLFLFSWYSAPWLFVLFCFLAPLMALVRLHRLTRIGVVDDLRCLVCWAWTWWIKNIMRHYRATKSDHLKKPLTRRDNSMLPKLSGKSRHAIKIRFTRDVLSWNGHMCTWNISFDLS